MQNWAYISIEKQGKRNVGSLDYPVALVHKREDFIVQNVDFNPIWPRRGAPSVTYLRISVQIH